MATAASCDLLGTEPAAEQEDPGDTAGTNAREAPALAQQVEAGDLPPVEERLPKQPLVVEPFERIGRYGGDWNSATAGPGDTVWLFRTIGYEQLMSWDVEFTEPILNVAEAVEVEDDGRTYTFRLREGMKWSDGEPFTADDIVFAWEDVLLNEELIGVAPRQLTVGDQPPELEKADDYTVRFVFAEPHGLFLQYLATPAGRHSTILPRHYLEQFHKKYNPDVDEVAQEQGFDDWVQLFLDRGGGWASRWENPELPTLQAWRITTPIGEGTRVVAERNPYYWKTDPEGSQLPYLDRIIYDVISDTEVILLRATNGELDMVSWHINSPTNKPVLARDRENGGYRFFDMTWSWPNRMVIMLNLTCQDPELREVLQNKDFRIGLSHAINREELIAAVLQQQGEPWQAAPLPDSPFYDERAGDTVHRL